MTYQEKCDAFTSKDARTAFRKKTKIEELPLILRYGSGSHNPEQNVQMETCDLVLWVKFLDKWFRPYGNFDSFQIQKMIKICHNDNQIVALFELLAASKEDAK